MKSLFLYLDESGSFEEDSLYKDSPSIVGGLLVADSTMYSSDAKRIVGIDNYHSVDIPGHKYSNTILPKLEELNKLGHEFVVFENLERLEVVDGDTTYLNVLSEGIIQLLNYFTTIYPKFKLTVVIAVRKAFRSDYEENYIINKNEYKNRLQEKLILGISKGFLNNLSKDNWEISFSSAKSDSRLWIADMICHSWFRQNQKFNVKEKKKLLEFFNPTFRFSVFATDTEVNVQKMIYHGRLGDCLFDLLSESSVFSEKYFPAISKKLLEIDEHSSELQLQILFNKIQHLIRIDQFDQLSTSAIYSLEMFVDGYLVAIDSKFRFNLNLLKLTLFTRTGNIVKSNECILECEKHLGELLGSWSNLDLYFVYKLRKAVHLINMYAFNECIDEMNNLESLYDSMLLNLSKATGVPTSTNQNVDTKGKILGTRIQSRLFIAAKNPNQYKLAREESIQAINIFEKQFDKNRQYQYRTKLEYMSGYYDEALRFLFLSHGLIYEKSSVTDLLQLIIHMDLKRNIYTVMHLIILALKSKSSDIQSTFNLIVESIENVNLISHVKASEVSYHPFEIVFWKYAVLLCHQGKHDEADVYFKKAIEICGELSENHTLHAILIGIKAEKFALSFERLDFAKTDFLSLQSDLLWTYKNVINLKLPNSMQRHFVKQKTIIEKIKFSNPKEAVEILLGIAEDIVY